MLLTDTYTFKTYIYGLFKHYQMLISYNACHYHYRSYSQCYKWGKPTAFDFLYYFLHIFLSPIKSIKNSTNSFFILFALTANLC